MNIQLPTHWKLIAALLAAVLVLAVLSAVLTGPDTERQSIASSAPVPQPSATVNGSAGTVAPPQATPNGDGVPVSQSRDLDDSAVPKFMDPDDDDGDGRLDNRPMLQGQRLEQGMNRRDTRVLPTPKHLPGERAKAKLLQYARHIGACRYTIKGIRGGWQLSSCTIIATQKNDRDKSRKDVVHMRFAEKHSFGLYVDASDGLRYGYTYDNGLECRDVSNADGCKAW